MIGQYLSNTNESATIPILQNFLKLNKALEWNLGPKYFGQNTKFFAILHFGSKHVQNILALNFLQN